MKRDKKARGSLLRFIVLDDIARPTVLAGPDESLLFRKKLLDEAAAHQVYRQ